MTQALYAHMNNKTIKKVQCFLLNFLSELLLMSIVESRVLKSYIILVLQTVSPFRFFDVHLIYSLLRWYMHLRLQFLQPFSELSFSSTNNVFICPFVWFFTLRVFSNITITASSHNCFPLVYTIYFYSYFKWKTT
jgi:hypothetical protein